MINIFIKIGFESCPKPEPPKPEKVCMLWGMECFTSVMILTFSIVSSTFLVAIFVSNLMKVTNLSDEERLIREGKLRFQYFILVYLKIIILSNFKEQASHSDKAEEVTIERNGSTDMLNFDNGSFFQRIGARTEQFFNSVFQQ